ncbi:hypothetical protein MTR67_003380 [Solanum verrucosum]|uniref:Reverse transcriptase Ty1/copia-type domain-containing protein n=1 Tax=Solanum verrucosum TaxID=315347 RepID=A0AAF0PU76_SOLVR|nr:hypothetical protein MTR67_003380 [Solanum verrucosum]
MSERIILIVCVVTRQADLEDTSAATVGTHTQQESTVLKRTFSLDSFVLDSNSPTKTITVTPTSITTATKSSTTQAQPEITSNPTYEEWRRSNLLILVWLRQIIYDPLLGHLTRASSSYDAWTKIVRMFQSQTCARLMQLKSQLQNFSKGNLSILGYFEKKRTIVDSLAESLYFVQDDDFISFILNGLDSSFGIFRQTPSRSIPKQAHLASPSAIVDPAAWYFDSGATHLVTSDMANLSLQTYTDNDGLAVGNELTTYHQTSKFPEWHHAMQIFLALMRNKTWTLFPPPSNSNIVGCKWVYRIKRKVDGSIERHKARLVAKGFHQNEGANYFDTFSPVVKPTIVRLILSLVVTNKWSVRQLDINNAFLNGDLSEQVFMEQPKGFVDPHEPHFLASKHTTYVLVYVDDLIITGSDSDFITTFIHTLDQQFSLKNLGSLNYFLGIEVSPTSYGIILSQGRYIRDLLRRTNMVDAKPISSPTEPGSRLILFGDPLPDAHLYRSVVGALQYVTITRPEISYAVNRVCQFMQSPTIAHWSAVKCILRYLKGSIHNGLLLRPMSDFCLMAFSDAGWISDLDDSHSQHGFAIFYGGNLISWSSQKQTVVTRSSTEAEYCALAFATTELIWVQQLISELRAPLTAPSIVLCDNLSAQFLSRNPVIHQRSKHIRLDYHFI